MSKTYEPDPVAVEHLRALHEHGQHLHSLLAATKGATVLSVPAGAGGASAQRASILTGYAFRALGGNPASLEIRTLTGALLVPINLAANETTRDSFAGGVTARGLSVVVVSGTVDGSVFFR